MDAGGPLGIAGYLVGLGVISGGFVAAARTKPPSGYATWSVLAALLWLTGGLVALLVGLLADPGTAASTWVAAGQRLGALTPFLATGFGAQVLLGALTYLMPVALRGGPVPVRAASAVLDRGGALRVVATNAGLLVCALPVPSAVRVLTSAVALGALASFLPLAFLAVRASRRAKREAAGAHPGRGAGGARGPVRPEGDRPPGQVHGLAITGLALVAMAVAIGAAVDPAALGGGAEPATASAAAGVVATGHTTTVQVSARDMRFTPSAISVPSGDRLIIELTNTDPHEVHDLVLESGQHSSRLPPGASERIDAGVVSHDLTGWCSVIGHRQLGMVLHISVTGPGRAPAQPRPPDPHQHPDDQQPHPMAEPPPGFVAYDPTLPPMTDEKVHRRTLTLREQVRDVAPGVTQDLWTYDGIVPGPTLHGRIGDVFEITLRNAGSIGHSIDFHAGALAPDAPMRTIPPGQSLVYRFTANRAGVWMYHCSSMPMSAHIANGLFGAVVIEPPDLPRADRSYLIVQSEQYHGGPGQPVDLAKLDAERPDAVVFNGYPNQYDRQPLPARAGERVRIWVLDAGPNRPTSFHVVGGQFDTVFTEGAYLLRPGTGGSQALALAPAQGGFVELTFPEPGHYPFLSHLMTDAERGAHGMFTVTN